MSYVEQIQTRQHNLRDEIYAAQDENDRKCLNKAYDDTVAMLIEMLGTDALVGEIDIDLGGFFSDWWKDEYGCRPSNTWTYAEVKKKMDSLAQNAVTYTGIMGT